MLKGCSAIGWRAELFMTSWLILACVVNSPGALVVT